MAKNEEKMIIETDPFIAGRREAAERYGHLAANAAQWRRISLLLLICCVACVFAVIYTSSKITVVPYIVQVDQHGYQIAVQPIAPANIDQRMIISFVARYVWSLRTIFTDPEAQLYNLNFIYNTTSSMSPAEMRYQNEFKEKNTLESKTSIHAIVNTILPLSEKTWQAEWTEEEYQDGKKISTKYYRGIFETTISTASKEMDDVIANPLGIFITDYNYSTIVNQK